MFEAPAVQAEPTAVILVNTLVVVRYWEEASLVARALCRSNSDRLLIVAGVDAPFHTWYTNCYPVGSQMYTHGKPTCSLI